MIRHYLQGHSHVEPALFSVNGAVYVVYGCWQVHYQYQLMTFLHSALVLRHKEFKNTGVTGKVQMIILVPFSSFPTVRPRIPAFSAAETYLSLPSRETFVIGGVG